MVNSIARAVNLCENTLAFGKAEETAPRLSKVDLGEIIDEVLTSERLAIGEAELHLTSDVPENFHLHADPEQLFRVVSNLVRNARQAILAARQSGEIVISAWEDDKHWVICVSDDGPGLPPKARENLFRPFQGGTRKEGTGLGLAISSELMRGSRGASWCLNAATTKEPNSPFAYPRTASTSLSPEPPPQRERKKKADLPLAKRFP